MKKTKTNCQIINTSTTYCALHFTQNCHTCLCSYYFLNEYRTINMITCQRAATVRYSRRKENFIAAEYTTIIYRSPFEITQKYLTCARWNVQSSFRNCTIARHLKQNKKKQGEIKDWLFVKFQISNSLPWITAMCEPKKNAIVTKKAMIWTHIWW